MPRVAVYISNHGYGHCVRSGEVIAQLAACRALKISVCCPLEQGLWPAGLDARLSWRREACDAGVAEDGALRVDLEATEKALRAWKLDYERFVDAEARRLRGAVDLVIGDVPPAAFEAAAIAGVRSVALANFSWDWIYAELGLVEAAEDARRAYAQADLLLELEPAAPMPAFVRRRSVGILGRRSSRDRESLRRQMGFGRGQRVVLMSFRAVGPPVFALPPPCDDIVYLVAAVGARHGGRADVLELPANVSYAELLLACDIVVCKPGYGILGDIAASGIPALLVDRAGFPEDVVLKRWFAAWPAAKTVEASRLLQGIWIEELRDLLSAERAVPLPVPAAREAAEVLASYLG